MRQMWAATCLATCLFVDQTTAADQVEKAAAAQAKAAVLEERAAAEGSKASPSRAEIITKPEGQAVDLAGEEPLDHAIICLARSIYWEAKGEGDAGMEAVANVVMNRLGHTGFPNSVCGVVKQGHEQGACQFSWWCDGRSDTAEEEESYAGAKEIARKALNRQLTDRTGGAMYFHQRDLAPKWAGEYTRTAEVGDHVFYKPPGDEAK
ncbi:MAG: cell wall hydrolase [Deferrisomatales bacterium]